MSRRGVTAAAVERGVAPEELAGEILAERFSPRPTLSFIGIGNSGQQGSSEAERHKELRRTHFVEKTASDV